uniref:uncharacterized protein LOC122593671 n=1 Tax=Erigeron canadensis TaxID=72917 RepID=UPI001CB8AFB7|nr:uncharacterized protein LOC122593671 [Erigeron canadensis]XP_043622045.1 uncharacterized protein LOC122593671 [Erigeron canadensis]
MADASSLEEEEVEKLEKEVKEMCEKISEYRDSMPHRLHTTLSSFLSSSPPITNTDLVPSSSTNPISEENGALVEADPTHADKIQTIKHKISNNASMTSSLLTRMKDCMSRIDKLYSFNNGSHPAFKRRKIAS